jgi:hypothetical protein
MAQLLGFMFQLCIWVWKNGQIDSEPHQTAAFPLGVVQREGVGPFHHLGRNGGGIAGYHLSSFLGSPQFDQKYKSGGDPSRKELS